MLPVAVDLFCGAGGLSFGMKQAGIRIAAGIDDDPACQHPFEANVKAKFIRQDITFLSPALLDPLFPSDCIRVLAGCAPCQPFSSYSRQNAGRRDEWGLLAKFGEMVASLEPTIVTMENVPMLAKHHAFREYLRVLDDTGYYYSYEIARCADYGVPQTRGRLVLLASKLGDIRLLPATHEEDEAVTAGDAIRHLERIGPGEASARDPLHKSSGLSARNLERIRNSQPGGTWRDWDPVLRASCHIKGSGRTYPSVYGRMEWDAPAPTITTQFNGFGNGRFGHPEQDRAISLREGALLQTFPEDYSFVPDGEPVRIAPLARLIGNAVPVRLGEAIGTSILSHLEDSL